MKIKNKYITYFANLLDSSKEQLELDLQSKENILQSALSNLDLNTNQKKQREKILLEISEFLKAQIKECEMLQYYATRKKNA